MTEEQIKAEEKRVKAGVEILPGLRRKLKQRAVELDRPMYELTEQALEAYLDGVKVAPADDPDLARCRYVLEHSKRVADFRSVVDMFYADAKRNPRKAPRRKAG